MRLICFFSLVIAGTTAAATTGKEEKFLLKQAQNFATSNNPMFFNMFRNYYIYQDNWTSIDIEVIGYPINVNEFTLSMVDGGSVSPIMVPVPLHPIIQFSFMFIVY